jgi:hypothetical protein
MAHIIVWRANTREPHVDTDSRDFIKEYESHQKAKETAEEIERAENEDSKSQWYYNFKIYEESNG